MIPYLRISSLLTQILGKQFEKSVVIDYYGRRTIDQVEDNDHENLEATEGNRVDYVIYTDSALLLGDRLVV